LALMFAIAAGLNIHTGRASGVWSARILSRPDRNGRRDHLPRLTSSQDSEQSVNNSLPNTREQQVLTRATGTKNPRAQPPALRR
jgi:hypothetical protein